MTCCNSRSEIRWFRFRGFLNVLSVARIGGIGFDNMDTGAEFRSDESRKKNWMNSATRVKTQDGHYVHNSP